jgi:hypothetical protein
LEDACSFSASQTIPIQILAWSAPQLVMLEFSKRHFLARIRRLIPVVDRGLDSVGFLERRTDQPGEDLEDSQRQLDQTLARLESLDSS